MARTVMVLNGPNLNLLGSREPEIYGTLTLADIEAMVRARAALRDLVVDFRQSNHEGVLIDALHEAQASGCIGVILNAAGLTHTSVALHDAIKAISVPVVEVHISNPHKRESFRHVSYVSMAARGTIAGLGAQGYVLAVEALAQ
jgi:3-dehydroquinate dehydratase II